MVLVVGGGVYPNALVTLAFVKLIVPELLVIFEPTLTKPKVEDVAASYVVLVSGGVCQVPSARNYLVCAPLAGAGTKPEAPAASAVAPVITV